MSAPAAPASIPTGNTFDKYGARSPVVRALMDGFERALEDLLATAEPESVLDVGCGEGVLTERWARRLGTGRVVGVDLADPKLQAEWEARRRPNLTFETMEVERLQFSTGEFDLVAATEVLEHVADPGRALREMTRVARRWMLVSVPREPLWRALNLARGAYVRQLGNTPGHLNHFSRRGFVRLLAAHGQVVAVRSPLPWTMLLVRVG